MTIYGIVYLVKNVIDGKVYVGQTRKSAHERWRQHVRCKKADCPKLHNAIGKYGPEKFTVEEFCYCFDKESLDKSEIDAILAFDSINSGYNIQAGGNSSNKGIKKNPEWIAKIVRSNRRYKGKNSPLYGRTRSEEDRKKMSANRPKRAVIGQNIGNGSFIRFESLREAERNGFYHANIIAAIKGKTKSCGGYVWKYE